MGLDKIVVKVGMRWCSDDKKREVEDKWIQLGKEEADLHLKKVNLANEEAKIITEGFEARRKAGK